MTWKSRVRWFEAFLIVFVLGWGFVIFVDGNPPRFPL